MSHLGTKNVSQLMRERVFWTGTEKHSHHCITKVFSCVKKRKPHCPQQVPLGTITISHPSEIIIADFLHMDSCSKGYQYKLVVTDEFTKFTKAYATRNKSVKTAAERDFNDFILRLSMLAHILHDQRRKFQNTEEGMREKIYRSLLSRRQQL